MKRKISFDLLVTLISCVLYGTIAFLPFKAKPLGDLDFHLQSKQLAQFLWGNADYSSLIINKAPGPVLFFVTPYFLTGPSASDDVLWFSGIIWSFIFITLGILMIRKAATHLGYDRAGKIAVVALLVLPLHLYYSLGILAEGLAFFGCCVFIYGWSLVLSKKATRVFSTPWLLFVTGLLCILLARPNSILMIPFLLIAVLVLAYWKKDPQYYYLRKVFLGAIALLTVVLSVITLWVKNLPGNQKTSSSQEGYLSFVMLIGRFQFREETWDWRFWDSDKRADSKDYKNWQAAEAQLQLRAKEQHQSPSGVYYDHIVSDIIEHPLTAFKQAVVRALFGHVLQVNSVQKQSFGFGPLRGEAIFWLFHIGINLLNGIFIVLSLYFLWHISFYDRTYLVLLVPWAALVVFHSLVYMEQRYLFPIRPVIILCGSIAIANYFQKRYLVKKA